MFDFADADSDGRLSFREFEVVVDVNVMHMYIENYENKIGAQQQRDEYMIVYDYQPMQIKPGYGETEGAPNCGKTTHI